MDSIDNQIWHPGAADSGFEIKTAADAYANQIEADHLQTLLLYLIGRVPAGRPAVLLRRVLSMDAKCCDRTTSFHEEE